MNESRKIIAPEEIDKVLSSLYYDGPCTGFGRDKMFQYVSSAYQGITRRRLHAWLKKQELYQLTRPITPANPIKPIITSRPHTRWQCDLLHVSSFYPIQNRNTKYLLTVVDIFSKYLYVRPLTRATANAAATAIQSIFNENKREFDGQLPHIMQSDQGGEFKGEFSEALKANGVKQIYSMSRRPQSNGVIDSTNRSVKNFINSTLLKQSGMYGPTKYEWVSKLQDFVKAYNLAAHSTTGVAPILAHRGRNTNKVAERIRSAASGRLAVESKFQELKKGDRVRIARFSLDAKVRRREQSALETGPTAKWSQDIFVIKHKRRPKNTWDPISYSVAPISSEGAIGDSLGTFTRAQLQLVTEVEAPIKLKV